MYRWRPVHLEFVKMVKFENCRDAIRLVEA